MKKRRLLILLLAASLSAPASAIAEVGGPGAQSTFLSLIVSDGETSSAWYRRIFAMEERGRSDRPGSSIRLLSNSRLMVELIDLTPDPPARERRLGYAKAGLIIERFDETIAAWQAAGVQFRGPVFYDHNLRLHSALILDPDGNIIQVFGNSRPAPTD